MVYQRWANRYTLYVWPVQFYKTSVLWYRMEFTQWGIEVNIAFVCGRGGRDSSSERTKSHAECRKTSCSRVPASTGGYVWSKWKGLFRRNDIYICCRTHKFIVLRFFERNGEEDTDIKKELFVSKKRWRNIFVESWERRYTHGCLRYLMQFSES